MNTAEMLSKRHGIPQRIVNYVGCTDEACRKLLAPIEGGIAFCEPGADLSYVSQNKNLLNWQATHTERLNTLKALYPSFSKKIQLEAFSRKDLRDFANWVRKKLIENWR